MTVKGELVNENALSLSAQGYQLGIQLNEDSDTLVMKATHSASLAEYENIFTEKNVQSDTKKKVKHLFNIFKSVLTPVNGIQSEMQILSLAAEGNAHAPTASNANTNANANCNDNIEIGIDGEEENKNNNSNNNNDHSSHSTNTNTSASAVSLSVLLSFVSEFDDTSFLFELRAVERVSLDSAQIAMMFARMQARMVRLEEQIEKRRFWNTLTVPITMHLNFAICNEEQTLDMGRYINGSNVNANANGVIDETVQEILINVVLRSGSEKPNAWYFVDLWTIATNASTSIRTTASISPNMNKKRIRGWHYPQSAISFNSENMWFPMSTHNHHGGEIQILGWR